MASIYQYFLMFFSDWCIAVYFVVLKAVINNGAGVILLCAANIESGNVCRNVHLLGLGWSGGGAFDIAWRWCIRTACVTCSI